MQTIIERIHSPLAETLARIAPHNTYAYVDTGILEEGWFRLSELIQDDSTQLSNALARQALQYPHMDARTRGSYLMGEYAWYVASSAVTACLIERRVPDLSPENMALRFTTVQWEENGSSGEGDRLDIRFLSGRFAALPDDPDAAHPDAIILPDASALREWLRIRLEEHMTPLIERVTALTRLGRRAQWCLVADSCASAFLGAGLAIENEQLGASEGLQFVKVVGSPMNNPNTGFVTLTYQQHCETFLKRGGCCRYYTVATDGEKCTSCVLRKPADREQRLLDYLSRKHSQEKAS